MRPGHKFGFRSSLSKNGLPGEGRHEGLVTRNDVLVFVSVSCLAFFIKFVHDLVITILCFRPFSKHAILMSALASFRNMPLKIFSSRDVS